ncbi:MAG: Uma2 family endonuclease [Coleofasciculaceae cyanobacterium SM2_1_6]|nr:Uma2 family endonuclease [Coleofasciculaceae cyanobacterium SM2_1_6]
MITRYDATTTYLPSAEELPYSDGKPVDNEFQNLIPNLLQLILSSAWKSRTDWFFGVDMGIYYHPQKPAVVPDGFLSLGVNRSKGGDDEGRSSYVLWEENYVVPILAIETVSKTYGGEYEQKRDIYAQMGVLYYAVFLIKPKARRGHQIFEIYRLVDGEYELLPGDQVWMPEIGLALGRERGLYNHQVRNWLYWYDESGRRLPTPQEETEQERQRADMEKQRAEQEKQRAEQEKQRADMEKQRADRLAQKLRELGLDPEELS